MDVASSHDTNVLLMRHTSAFPVKRLVQVRGLEPRIDSPSWSFTAWVQLEKGKGANILRKPLGTASTSYAKPRACLLAAELTLSPDWQDNVPIKRSCRAGAGMSAPLPPSSPSARMTFAAGASRRCWRSLSLVPRSTHSTFQMERSTTWQASWARAGLLALVHAGLTRLFGSCGGHRKQHPVLLHRCGASRHGKGGEPSLCLDRRLGAGTSVAKEMSHRFCGTCLTCREGDVAG